METQTRLVGARNPSFVSNGTRYWMQVVLDIGSEGCSILDAGAAMWAKAGWKGLDFSLTANK